MKENKISKEINIQLIIKFEEGIKQRKLICNNKVHYVDSRLLFHNDNMNGRMAKVITLLEKELLALEKSRIRSKSSQNRCEFNSSVRKLWFKILYLRFKFIEIFLK